MPLFLFLSTLALFLGPALLHFAIRKTATLHFFDAFVICSILGIVVFHVLPESIMHGGFLALAAALFGLFSPIITGRLFKNGNCHIHHTLLSLASVGLFAHAALDGMALYGTNQFLAFAVVLHRLPEGMGIWRLTASRVGKLFALAVLCAVALSTIGGFFFGELIIHYLDETTFSIFEGLMAGVLLHVIFHRRHLDELESNKIIARRSKRLSEVLGVLCGSVLVLILFVATPLEHSHAESPVRVSNKEL